MKSIRRSLTFYYVGLLVLALGAVALFVSSHTEHTLRAEEEVKEKLIVARYKADERREKARLDNALLNQARALSSFLRFHYDHGSIFHGAIAPQKAAAGAGAISAAFMPNAHITVPGWAMQARSRSMYIRHYQHASNRIRTEIRLDDENLLQPISKQSEEFFQVDSDWGSTYFSPGMNGRSFAFDPAVLKTKDQLLDWSFETVQLGDTKARVVKMRVPAARFVPLPHPSRRPRGGVRGSGRRGGWDRSSKGSPSFQQPDWARRPRPALYIQYACEIGEHQAALAKLKARRDKELQTTRQETAASLQEVRNYLVLLLGGTFVLGSMGCFWLVRLGLAPLRRLSEAVSRVSEKDFRLQYDGKNIPREVTPIVERLNQTLEMLKRAFAREKQATADISHDLRTPVAALLATIDFAVRRPRSAEEYRDALLECRESGQQMNQIVEQLLSLARLDAGVAHLQANSVNITELAEQCVSLVRPLAEAKGITMSFHSESQDAVKADAVKLREVLNNLLQNAIQYNRPNGSINVEVLREADQLRLMVRDTGIGIPAESQNLIFERFYRVDPSRTTDGLNVGLGLAIVQGYVDLMGGRLSVQSEEGQGSTFSVYLPA